MGVFEGSEGLVIIAVALFASVLLVLLVLGIFMPYFVYKISGDVSEIKRLLMAYQSGAREPEEGDRASEDEEKRVRPEKYQEVCPRCEGHVVKTKKGFSCKLCKSEYTDMDLAWEE